MSSSDVTREGLRGARPDVEARMWEQGGRRGGRAEDRMVPEAEFRSYYGRAVVKRPVWKVDIALYFFTGGLMAGSSLLAAGADAAGNRALRRLGRLSALGNLAAGSYFLIHDLGRPDRFYNMLRVVKPTSPMSIGTWILAAYGPAAGLAAASELTGALPGVGRGAGVAAAALAPAVATYTAVLTADTSVPVWHESYQELPFVFAGSAAAAGGGLGVAALPPASAGPARRFAVLGAALELAASRRMQRRMGLVGEVFHQGRAGRLRRMAEGLTVAGALGALAGRRHRGASLLGGAALLAGSLCTRLAVFEAGIASATDPRYTVVPQRRRVDEGRPVRADDVIDGNGRQQ